jgi:transcription antitermination protein NusB
VSDPGLSDPDLPVYRGGLGSRREAREHAVALLYEAEAKAMSPAELLAELPLAPEAFTVELVEGVGSYQAEIDEWLRSHARDWKLERMPVIDRAVLRLSVFELVHRPEIPTGVVISEAVELAKRYSTDESGRFVNGMLSAIAIRVRPDIDRVELT